jgi:hypothetical protein
MSRLTVAVFVSISVCVGLAGSASAAPLVQRMMSSAPEPNAFPPGCSNPHLSYSNGPLIQNVKVFDVFWSPGYAYKDMLTSYYTAITQSAYFDWLSEYNVTNYKIGRGSFIGLYEDTHSATTKVTLDDAKEIPDYINSLIDNHKVPAPDDDTIYMIYFPAAATITLQGYTSCQYFCAYHHSYSKNGQMVRYAIMPDVNAGLCALGCGSGAAFANLTSVSAHELIEAVTDPDDGTGWYDNTPNSQCGEIGDICNGSTGTVANFTVQKEWSNTLNACVVTNPNVSVNDFKVAVSPSTLTVPAGGSAMAMVNLTKVAGMAENAALSAPMPPAGLTASFSPTSVTSDGGKSTMTVMVAPTQMPGTMLTFTVKATGTTVKPTATVTVMVTAPPDMSMVPDMAMGGGGNGGSGGGGNGGSGGGDGGGSGCSLGGDGSGLGWLAGALFLLAFGLRRLLVPRARRLRH